MAAVTQVRHRHSKGRTYYDKKIAEGKTPKEALRSLKRQVSNAIFACLQADARRAAASDKGPGGQQGAGRHQHARRASQRAGQRRGGEHRGPDDQDPPPAQQVRQAAAEQQEPAERQRVPAEHPLQANWGK